MLTIKFKSKLFSESVKQLSKIMFIFANLPRESRISNKLLARNIAAKADWKFFVNYYFECHNKAVDKVY